jgi:FHA domain
MHPNTERRVIPLAADGRDSYTIVTAIAVAFIGRGDPVAQSILQRLITASTDPFELVDRVEALLGGDTALPYPPLALVASGSAGHHVLVHGDVSVVGTGTADTATSRLTTRRWQGMPDAPQRDMVTSLTALTVGVGTAHVDRPSILPASSLADLCEGTVCAAGFVVIWANGEIAPDASRDAGPAWVRHPPTGPLATPPRSINGVLCGRLHANERTARFCAVCGIVIRRHPVTRTSARPSRGVLVFDTGEVFEIDSQVVIGRAANHATLVSSGVARSLTPAGDVSGLSRVHAVIRQDDWRVEMVDHNSLNGTFRWDSSAGRWTRLDANVPVTLMAGDAIAFGRRTATFQAAHTRA